MILDRLGTLSENQSLAETAPDGELFKVSTNTIDLGANLREPFTSGLLAIEFHIITSFTAGAGAPRMQFGALLSESGSPGYTNNVIPVLTGYGENLIATGPGTGASALLAGQVFHVPIPPSSLAISGQSLRNASGMPLFLKRYLSAVYVQTNFSGNYFNAGVVSAYLVRMNEAAMRTQYPNAY